MTDTLADRAMKAAYDVGPFNRRTAYGCGYRAATDGSSNPYPAGSQLAKCWNAGLEHAREELA